MTYTQAMASLKRMGTARNVKVYKRHGAGSGLFGVSFVNLEKLRKKTGVDHSLARQLWRSGNTDARTLAVMIADPTAMTRGELETWTRESKYYLLVDLISGRLVGKSPHARVLMKKWTTSTNEWVGQAGWDVLAHLSMEENGLTDRELERYLSVIRRDIHSAKNRTRHAMNNALIAIGIRSPGLRKKALAAARAIGKVEVDHGETSCKTPDAADYIAKVVKRRNKK